MTAPLYELRGVTKSYGHGPSAVQALKALDLTIEAGEFTAVVGPSGSGKTTLMQLLGGLDTPTAGQILFEGRELAARREKELGALRLSTIGFVFQQFNLIQTVSAADNVALALAPRRLSGRVRHARVQELLAAVGLEGRASHLPSQMSGGEQQRVAIARALANEPRVVLADEPTGNLDSSTGAEIMAILRSLSAEQGRTVVLITHDQQVAGMASRTLRMRDGSLVGTGDERAPSIV